MVLRSLFALMLTFLLTNPCFSKTPPQIPSQLLLEGIPDLPISYLEKATSYLNIKEAFFASWGEKEDSFYFLKYVGDYKQIHKFDMNRRSSEQLTYVEGGINAFHLFPKSSPTPHDYILVMDQGGNENYQIFRGTLKGNRAMEQLSDGKSRYTNVRLSHKGDFLVYANNSRSSQDMDICYFDLKTKKERRLVESGGSYEVISLSPDDKKILLRRFVSINESYLSFYDIDKNELTLFNTDKKEKIAYKAAAWSFDSQSIYYSSDESSDWQQLFRYTIGETPKKELIETPSWDVVDIQLSNNGRFLAYLMNEGGYSKLYVRDLLDKDKFLSLPELPMGVIDGIEFSHDGNKVAINYSSGDTPFNILTLDLLSLMVTDWALVDFAGLSQKSFVLPTLMQIPTPDKNRTIPAFVYRSKKKSEGKKAVVINFHGGPEAQETPLFKGRFQYMLEEMDVVIISPNIRGSDGYGKNYLLQDNGFLRQNALDDVKSLLDWVASSEDMDPARVGVMGGSYGGYMSLASLVFYPDRFKAGIDIVGISNLVSFLQNTSKYRQDLRRAEYGDERDPEMRAYLEKISPFYHAEKIKAPLFVIQGKNDPRVPESESRQMVDRIRNNKGNVWFMMASDEGHGFSKKSNLQYMFAATLHFLKSSL